MSATTYAADSTTTTTTAMSSGAAFPFYYGLVIDKVIVGGQILFWWLITIPLIIWAFVRTALLYALLFGILLVPIVLTSLVGLFLFLVAVYWTPSISVALTTIAPLIAAGVEIGVFALNVAWFILIVLVDLWNILIPLFVVIFIYTIHFFLTVVTLVVDELAGITSSRARSPSDKLAGNLTTLFSELIDVAFFFADIVVTVLTVVVAVLPAALTLTITIAQPLLLLFFQTVVFVFQAVQFILLTLFRLLPSVFFSVLKLVRVFSSLLRSVPVVGPTAARFSGLNDDRDNYEPASGSPRYQAGMDAYFNALVGEASDKDWGGALATMNDIVAAQQDMPDYSHLSNPFGDERKRKRSDGSLLPQSRGSLHARWRGNASDTMREQRRRMYHDEELYMRGERAHVLGTALLEGMHSVLDTSAPLHTHHELMTRTLDKAAQVFGGHKSARDALNDYNSRYGHPALWLAHRVPDLHDSWLGRIVRESNPDDEFNAGHSHHEWRRAGYPPVEGHPNAETVNHALVQHRASIVAYGRKRAAEADRRARLDFVVVQPPDTGLPEGDVPLPFEMPVILGSDCFRSRPKFILCLPRPANRRFKAPDILIPTNLPDAATCPGFVPPPTPDQGLATVLAEMLNPITAIRNTWTWLRYVLSAFANVFYSINEQTITNPWLSWFFDLLSLNDISEDPLELDDLICLIPYAWYPFYLATISIAVIGFLLPLLWLVFSLIVYILLPFRRTWALVSRLLLYYELTAERVEVLDTRNTVDVARQKWWRDQTVMREGRGRAELEPGANAQDVVGEYERLRSQPFTEQRVSDELNGMNIDQLHRLYTIKKDVAKARRGHAESRGRVQAIVGALHSMGALSPDVRNVAQARVHMSRMLRAHPLPTHTSTLAFTQDRLRNMEVALGHRPLDDAVPLTDW